MKKMYLFLFLMFFILPGSAFSQFQGLIEIKEINHASKATKENNMSDMIPAEAKAEIAKMIKEKEAELKNKPKTDEDYEDLANELKMMKEQLGVSSESSEGNPKSELIRMYFLDNDVRTETITDKGAPQVAIIKVKDKKIITIMEEEKIYMELDFEMLKQMAQAFKGMQKEKPAETEKPESKTNIKKTGRTETILGYKCDEYILDEGETISSAWICPNFTSFWKVFSDMAKSFEMDSKSSPKDWFTEVVGEAGFPFKSIEKSKDGAIITEWQITNIDKSKPAASLFAPPKGYTKMDMSQMFNAK